MKNWTEDQRAAARTSEERKDRIRLVAYRHSQGQARHISCTGSRKRTPIMSSRERSSYQSYPSILRLFDCEQCFRHGGLNDHHRKAKRVNSLVARHCCVINQGCKIQVQRTKCEMRGVIEPTQ